MWPSCWASAGVAASASASSMHQNLDRTVRLGRAVGEEKDGYEQRAFCADRRGWGAGLPARQASDRCGDGERVRIEAEGDLRAAGNRRPPNAGGVVEPHLEPCRVTRHERDVLCQIGVKGVEQAKRALHVAAVLDLDMKWSERFLRPRSREVQHDGLRSRRAYRGRGGD